MQPQLHQDVTGLLKAWGAGDACALEALIPLVEKELHRIARHYMASRHAGQTLQTTALVNEAYLHLIDAQHVSFHDRSHFLAACCKIMRRILMDRARARNTAKRGGEVRKVPLEEPWAASPEP